NPVQELQGSTVTANILSGGLDEVLLRTDSAGPRIFLVDAIGSTVALTDATAALQTQYTYDAFGKTSTSGPSSSSSFQFTGREADPTGLYYYRARYYNPTLGRFISEDPIGFAGGDSNLYAYVSNDPTNTTDPTGEIAPWLAACLGGAAFDAGWQLGSNYLAGRGKNSGLWNGVGIAAARGCASGLVGFGVGEAFGLALKAGTGSAQKALRSGTKLYRVFGNKAQGLGNYYTTINPGTVADYRTAAGLFPSNSGRFVLEGTLKQTDGAIFGRAAAG